MPSMIQQQEATEERVDEHQRMWDMQETCAKGLSVLRLQR